MNPMNSDKILLEDATWEDMLNEEKMWEDDVYQGARQKDSPNIDWLKILGVSDDYVFEDRYGNILTSEEVEELSPWEIAKRRIHRYHTEED